MTKKSHHDDPAPERANEIKEELHHLDEVEASLHTSEPMFGQPAIEGADMGSDLVPIESIPLDTRHPTLADVVQPHHEDIHELMAGWWKEVKQLTLAPAQTGDHFVAYAAARGWQLVEAPTPEQQPVP